jgi:uncharacterized repeat protein (TIGR03803 family)
MCKALAERRKAAMKSVVREISIVVLALLLLSGACLAQAPTGVFAIAPGSAQNPFLIPQPNVAGETIFVRWSEIDNGTSLDWSSVESAIAPWWAGGKKTGLIVWAVSDDPAEIATPAYVLAQLPPTVSCTTWTNVPEFTATAFVSAYSNFLTAFFAKYGNDPRIAYIRAGIGIGGETYPGCTSAQEASDGLTEASWTAYVDAILAVQQPLMGSVPVMVAFNCYGTPCPQNNSYALSQNIATLAAQYGMGIGKESLQQSDLTAWNAGQPCDANWCALFQQYPNEFHDLQFAEPTCADGNCPVGSPIQLLPFAAARGADVVEMLASTDLTIAYGPNPGPYTAAYQQAIANFVSAVNQMTPQVPAGLGTTPGHFTVTKSKQTIVPQNDAIFAAGGKSMMMPAAVGSPPQALTTLHSFDGADGYGPEAALIQGTDGNLYGTTVNGGAYGNGTVFKISTGGTLATLYNFCSQGGGSCTDGGYPSGLVQGADGNFYGTTVYGGANGSYGTIFKITSSGSLTTLYSFCAQHRNKICKDGTKPVVGLVQATSGSNNGDFYGTTEEGGGNGGGTIFKITPSGTLTTVHNFCSQGGSSCTDGYFSEAALAEGANGTFYGTTVRGGANGDGTVFKITSGGKLTTLHSFDRADGYFPEAALVQGTNGAFYGATVNGGLSGAGNVFKIAKNGTLTSIYSFCSQSNCADGESPNGLIRGADGDFYGTAPFGGAAAACTNANGCGTFFKIAASGALTTVYNFCSQGGCADGAYPDAPPVQVNSGTFYGTTYGGGASESGYGTVFSLSVGVGPFMETQPASVAAETVTNIMPRLRPDTASR